MSANIDDLLKKLFHINLENKNMNIFDENLLLSGFKNKDLKIVKSFISEISDLNHVDKNGRTLISLTAAYGWTELFDILLEHNVNIDIKDNEGYHTIHYAVKSNNITIIKSLLDLKPDCINVLSNRNVSPLLFSIGYGGQEINIEIIECLLAHNADVNFSMEDGDTPMHMAAHKGRLDVMKILVEHGAVVDAKNKEDETPLYISIQQPDGVSDKDKKLIVQYLLSKY
eukprot:GHVL01015880.1.p1 GENE.GHVL01015880.1~~GHVL01015880.1.p1  ORF type:complete len:227 (+),score=49.36 GHVL01015880.1:101-781(+)